MNRKGFTLIELITTFALASVLIILLINIILIIKDTYTKNSVKSELIVEQSNLSHLINTKFDDDSLKTYTACDESDFCYDFDFVDGTTSRLIVTDSYIRFDNYTYKLSNGTSIDNPTMKIIDIDVSSLDVYNSILVIKIPIKNKLYPNEDFGLNIVYQYNSNEITL